MPAAPLATIRHCVTVGIAVADEPHSRPAAADDRAASDRGRCVPAVGRLVAARDGESGENAPGLLMRGECHGAAGASQDGRSHDGRIIRVRRADRDRLARETDLLLVQARAHDDLIALVGVRDGVLEVIVLQSRPGILHATLGDGIAQIERHSLDGPVGAAQPDEGRSIQGGHHAKQRSKHAAAQNAVLAGHAGELDAADDAALRVGHQRPVDRRLLLESGGLGHREFPDVRKIREIGAVDVAGVVALIGPHHEPARDRRVVLAGGVVAHRDDLDVVQVGDVGGVDIPLAFPDHDVAADIDHAVELGKGTRRPGTGSRRPTFVAMVK